ncbi:hypothetical protein M0R88_01980 [Halorussus gelatinilyticus]|uniref:Uncharacterized protein n=1 Tax=Halorussus gelatinilyticus TaxID=2937524 RepID=A0A8U0IIM4_9EURY|nr:hypothetical protein [Halorussus gelatinilyticus]UPW00883.1 hypothetical protein M0R88_01980 [Halorussus gelatinilyticus]
MSNAPSTIDSPLTDELPDSRLADALELGQSALDVLATPFQFVGFWSAVVLPLFYVPVLAGWLGGGVPGFERVSLGLLLAVHAVALLAGHGHRAD